MENMETFVSADGRFEIIHNPNCDGWVQLVEYHGEAPRKEVNRFSFPFELLAGLMDKLMFAVPAPIEIEVTNVNQNVDIYFNQTTDNVVYYVD
jgi:hypothetical protein